QYAAWGPQGLHATCTALLVLMINATGEKVPIPDLVRAAIRALDAPAEESLGTTGADGAAGGGGRRGG
ncbi:MAG TPA: hypothetical protein VIR38_14240, partial [Thalassobaculum sp.]